MTAFGDVSALGRLFLLLTMFLVLCLQIFYLLLRVERRKTLLWAAVAVWFLISLALEESLFDTALLNSVPCFVLWLVAGASAAFSVPAVIFDIKRDKKRITRASVKEAMDDLPVAGCYFTENGRVKLCNRQMYTLFRLMTGHDLQSYTELKAAVKNCRENGITVTEDGDFIFPSAGVWHYSENRVTASDGNTYIEAVFTDVTRIFNANRELAFDNAELERINAKLQKMYSRAEEYVREREYLAFKMKIHDEIGHSLAVIRKSFGEETESAELESRVKALSLAVGTLVYTKKEDSFDPLDRLLFEADELGVEIKIDGMLPIEPLVYELTVSAVRECMTNCVKHAHGTSVFVKISALSGGYTVTVTNDGEKPKDKIREGTGLSTLRKAVESAGGEMVVSHYPSFMLRLILMREEMDL